MKQRIELLDKTKIVYKIPCKGAVDINGQTIEKCDESYVGHTANALRTRCKQHSLSTKSASYGNTALKTHTLTKNHQPDFDNVSVLATEPNYHKRLTQETLHILHQKTYNVRTDTQQISASYCALVYAHNKTKQMMQIAERENERIYVRRARH